MSANLIATPPSRGYNGDDNFISFASNLIDADPIARIQLDISGTGPLVGEEITIEWSGQTVVFTVATTINAFGTAWPVKSGAESLADYAIRVAEAIRQNGIITEAWQVLTKGPAGAAERIELVYRDRVELDVTVTENLTNMDAFVVDGTDPLQEPNLACLVQFWKVEPTLDDDTLLGSMHSPYQLEYGTTDFTLKDYFDLSATLPATTSINPGIITVWPNGPAYLSWIKYYFRFNDKYGAPAVPLALTKSNSYFMLHGSRSLDRVNVSVVGPIIPLHRYYRRDGGVFRKPIMDGMPDYIYFWAINDLVNCNTEIVVDWTDGSQTNHPSGMSDFDLDKEEIHWVKSSPKTFGYTPPSANAMPEYILFRLTGDGGSGQVTLMEVKYTVKTTADWGYFILFDNGLGGCETALFYGKSRRGIEVKRELATRSRGAETGVSTGEVFAVGVEGQRTFEMNTGWIEKYYVEHLQQLLLGPTWIIDRTNKRFIRVNCETSKVVVSEDDVDLYSMEVSFKLAFYDTAFNI